MFFTPGFQVHDSIPSIPSYPGMANLMVYREFYLPLSKGNFSNEIFFDYLIRLHDISSTIATLRHTEVDFIANRLLEI